jgi:hypothetical protein
MCMNADIPVPSCDVTSAAYCTNADIQVPSCDVTSAACCVNGDHTSA